MGWMGARRASPAWTRRGAHHEVLTSPASPADVQGCRSRAGLLLDEDA